MPTLTATPRTAALEVDDAAYDVEPSVDEEPTTEAQPRQGPPRRVGPRGPRPDVPNPFEEQLRRMLGPGAPGGIGGPPGIDGRITPNQIGGVPTEGQEVGQGGKGEGGKGQGQGGVGGGLFDEGGRAFAQAALQQTKPPSAQHPYVQHKDAIRGDLDRLGLMRPGTGRIHIDDVTIDHGFAVTRAAIGPTSLAQGADASLSTAGVPEAFRNGRRTEAQRARTDDVPDRRAQGAQGQLTSDGYVRLVADELEGMLLNHGDAVAYARSQLPDDGKDTFMNMSWGQSPERLLGRSAAHMLTAAEGTPAYEEVTQILGHPPTVTDMGGGATKLDPEEFEAVRGHLLAKLDPILGSDEHKARMETARGAFETELAAGRDQGLLVFAAAGNEHAGAAKFGRPDLAVSTASGAEGLMLVGATNLNGPGVEDDTIADFSNAGDIIVSAAGVDIPVMGARNGPFGMGGPGPQAPTDTEGTSIASPIAVEAAYIADAVNPELDVNQIGALLQDPRVLHDISGTDRDGAGQIDHFAVALLAANPNLSRAQIDAARTTMRGDPSDAEVAALKARLGLD